MNHQILLSSSNQGQDDMIRAYSTHGKYMKMRLKFRSENLKGKDHFVGRKWDNNNKMDHTSMGCEDVNWISGWI
jgi:hypothetical protein